MKARTLALQPYGTTRNRKRARRVARRHAQAIAATLPEKAATWRKRARNG